MMTVETALTERLADYFGDNGTFSLPLNFYAEAGNKEMTRPCCVISAETEEEDHPAIQRVTLELELQISSDDTAATIASTTAKELENFLPEALQESCEHFSSAGEFWVRKCRRVGSGTQLEGDRGRVWLFSFDVFVQLL